MMSIWHRNGREVYGREVYIGIYARINENVKKNWCQVDINSFPKIDIKVTTLAVYFRFREDKKIEVDEIFFLQHPDPNMNYMGL